jgi:flavodoxin
MKTLIVYMSVHHRNTEKVAKVIAEASKADIIDLNLNENVDIAGYDIIGFGSGIYFGSPHKKLIAFIKKLPQQNKKKAFVFSTSGRGAKQYNNKLETELSKIGFEVSESFSCKGFSTWGPFALIGGLGKNRPNKKDLENAVTYVQSRLR